MDFRAERRGRAVDVMLAISVTAVIVVAVAVTTGGARAPIDYALLAVSGLSLTWRRRFPVSVLAVTSLCAMAYYLRFEPDPAVAVPAVLAHYSAVQAGRRLPSVLAAAPFLVASLVAGPESIAAGVSALETVQARVLSIGWFAAAGVMGEVARQRQAYLEQVEQRAVDAERSREEAALRRAAEERLHIARELHDSLTHSISVIKVQAGVAAHLAEKRGEQVPGSLVAIQDASRDAMRELRSTLEVLRSDGEDGFGSGLARLPELLERTRAVGLSVTESVHGTARPLPAEVDRAAYRIVQEALTNVAKHAGPATADVRVHYEADRLTVLVSDDGDGGDGGSDASGVGLMGMRERVVALGGTVTAQRGSSGGFVVHAELPAGGV